MLASIDWLKKYVDINVTPEELAEKLTRVGLEVESVNYLGAGLEGVVTGKVTQIERHPNSDHLWICMMDYGSGEIVQILTGAQNVHQDDIVPVAVVGSQLPSGMKLKKAKMRGLDSFGMLCSAEELGIDAKLLLPEQRNGIFILPPDTPIGVDIKKVLGLDDVVLDIDLTANRGDCTNIIGLAREAAAVLGTEFRMPDMSVQETAGGNAAEMAKVDVQAADLCSRFAVRILKNIKIGQSPEWMQKHLRACGISTEGMIHHSDRGVQYASKQYTNLLLSQGIRISMTQTGDPLHNALAERMNNTLKNGWLFNEGDMDFRQAEEAVSKSVAMYNNARPHRALGMKTPMEVFSGRGGNPLMEYRYN